MVTDDPLFGLFAYGGELTKTAKGIEIVPKDRLRVRFRVIRAEQRFHMLLDRDGYAKDKPIVLTDSLSDVRFTLEKSGSGKHAAHS